MTQRDAFLLVQGAMQSAIRAEYAMEHRQTAGYERVELAKAERERAALSMASEGRP